MACVHKWSARMGFPLNLLAMGHRPRFSPLNGRRAESPSHLAPDNRVALQDVRGSWLDPHHRAPIGPELWRAVIAHLKDDVKRLGPLDPWGGEAGRHAFFFAQ